MPILNPINSQVIYLLIMTQIGHVNFCLNRKEINQLMAAKDMGLTIVPLTVELHGKLIKLRIATARGKRKADKRNAIRERDIARDTARDIKNKL
jgi:SsrA-binding protein